MFMLAISCSLCHFHFQFTLIHGSNIPDSYAIWPFTVSDLLSPPDIFTTGCCFCSGSISSFFLELFLYSSPVAYWAPKNLESSSFSVMYFLLFHTVHGILNKARMLKWFDIPFTSGRSFVRTLDCDLSVLAGPTQHAS